MSDDPIRSRKEDHIRLVLDAESQFDHERTPLFGFESYYLEHNALPEIALEDVDLSVEAFGKKISAPILVSSMTGGPEAGATINRHLGEAVEALKLGMGVGSQRIAIAQPDTAKSFKVRPHAPTALLFANFGAVQLNYGFGEKEAREVVEMIGADGLFLHLNAVQEAVQPEGDTNFRGLLQQIGTLARTLPFPVLVKECGAGIGPSAVAALHARGVAGIDVSGSGGTSWAKVEGMRAANTMVKGLGEAFRNWGIPTPIAVLEARAAAPNALIIASGGIRNGIDAAKALLLGADLVSIAQPVLAASLESGDAVKNVLQQFITELRVACFCTGAKTIAELKQKAILRHY